MQKGVVSYEEFQKMVRNAPPGSGINAKSIAASIERKGYKLAPELSSYSSIEPQEKTEGRDGFFEKLAKRNEAVTGSETGIVEAALNPSRTYQSDSSIGRLLRGEQGLGATVLQGLGQGAGTINDLTGEVAGGIFKGADYLTGGTLSKAGKAVAESEVGQAVGGAVESIAEQYQKFKQAFPQEARNLESIVNIASIIPLAQAPGAMVKTGKQIKKLAKGLTGTLDDAAKAGVPEKTLVDALKNSEAANAASLLDEAQATQAAVGWREKIAGIRPDIKKRITGKQQKLKEYFDVAHARNLDDAVPTPLEYGARSVEGARNNLQKIMGDTGSKIGQFRTKIASVKVGPDDMSNIEKSFEQSLGGLNLELRNGNIVRRAGKVAGKVSDSEVNTLQAIYDDLLRVKAAPSSENLIDLRNAVQDKINFAKTSREATNVIDPVSRKLRSTIRDVNLKMIGKEQGQLLDDYSDLVSVLEEMNSFVDSKRGGEFLLKQVLSERGRVPREIIKKVADYTGIDLMDDATMAQLATEIIGNPAQKGLFRQEITKAGLDAMDVLDIVSGAPGGTVRTGLKLLEKSKGMIAPTEKMFLKAAQ